MVQFPRGIGPGISREIPDLLKGVSTVFTRVHGGILPCYRLVRRTFSVFNNWILKGMGHPKSSPKSLGEYKTDILTSSKIRLSSDLVSIQK